MIARVVNSIVVDLVEKPEGFADFWIEDDGTAEIGCDWSEAQGFHNQAGEPPIRVLARCFVKVLKDNQDTLIIDDQVKAVLQRFKS